MGPLGNVREGLLALARWGGLYALLVMGCGEPLDVSRAPGETNLSLGGEVYKSVCERLASEENPMDVSGVESDDLCLGRAPASDAPTPRLRALAERRADLVDALDTAMPEATTDRLSDFLLAIRALYEGDELLPTTTRTGADLIGVLLADPKFTAALQRLSARQDYRRSELSLGATGALLAYPRLDALLDALLAAIDEGGSAAIEYRALLEVLALELAAADESEGADSTLAVARGLLFAEDPAFSGGAPVPLALRDARGLVVPSVLQAPLVDQNGDGLFDIDASGHAVDAAGDRFILPGPFAPATGQHDDAAARDAQGRALGEDGKPLYQVLDADQTLLAGLTQELLPLLDPGQAFAFGVAETVPLWLGFRRDQSERFGAQSLSYAGYDVDSAPVLDVAHGVGRLLSYPNVQQVLSVVRRLFDEYESELSALIAAGLQVDALADESAAHLTENSIFWDDFNRFVTWSAQEPGLLEGLLRALADERSRHLGSVIAEMARYKDPVDYDPNDINRVMTDAPMVTPVDRDAPDARGNQSLLYRLLWLFSDSNYAEVCNKEGAVLLGLYPLGGGFAKCEFFRIDNALAFYVDAVLGEAKIVLADDPLLAILPDSGGLSVDEIFEQQSGIDGLDTTPTAEAVTRLIFTPPNDFLADLIDPAESFEGVPLNERFPATLFALEREFTFPPSAPVNMKDVFRPLLEAFKAHDRGTDGRYLFGEMVTALAHHLPSTYDGPDATSQRLDPDALFYAPQSNVVSYEPLLTDSLDPSGIDLFGRLQTVLQALADMEVEPGVDGLDVISELAVWLADPAQHPDLTYRDGRTMSVANDGSRQIPATPLYELLDGLLALDAAYASAPSTHERWLAARSQLVDQLLTVEMTAEARFRNRRTPALVMDALDFASGRVQAHTDGGDLSSWWRGLSERLGASLGSALGARLLDFAHAIDADPALREEVSLLAEYLLQPGDGQARASTLATLHDLLQLIGEPQAVVPLLRGLSAAVDVHVRDAVAQGGATLETSAGLAQKGIDLLRAMRARDDTRVLTQVIDNLVTVPADGARTPLQVIVDVVADVNRAAPPSTADLSEADHMEILQRSEEFLTDPDRGVERLYKVVKSRRIAP